MKKKNYTKMKINVMNAIVNSTTKIKNAFIMIILMVNIFQHYAINAT